MKKVLFMSLVIIVLLVSSISFADLIDPNARKVEEVQEPETIEVVLNCARAIRYNSVFQVFYNAKGNNVFPISYSGTTYLPIRAISSMFKEGIEWDGATKSIYLGQGDVDTIASKDSEVRFYVAIEDIKAIQSKDIKIYYKGKIQTFTDANGKVVYPLSYQGTTYLPIRAISNLFGSKIEYDNVLDIVDITK